MRGITRANVIKLCEREGLAFKECDFYLTQVIHLVWVWVYYWGPYAAMASPAPG